MLEPLERSRGTRFEALRGICLDPLDIKLDPSDSAPFWLHCGGAPSRITAHRHLLQWRPVGGRSQGSANGRPLGARSFFNIRPAAKSYRLINRPTRRVVFNHVSLSLTLFAETIAYLSGPPRSELEITNFNAEPTDGKPAIQTEQMSRTVGVSTCPC